MKFFSIREIVGRHKCWMELVERCCKIVLDNRYLGSCLVGSCLVGSCPGDSCLVGSCVVVVLVVLQCKLEHAVLLGSVQPFRPGMAIQNNQRLFNNYILEKNSKARVIFTFGIIRSTLTRFTTSL